MNEISKSIDEYIERSPKDTQAILHKIRKTIKDAAPMATEKISYGMPCFWQKENLVYFAAMKSHIGFYPTAKGVAEFADKLIKYKPSKGTIRFPASEEIPYSLITEITKFRVNQVNDTPK